MVNIFKRLDFTTNLKWKMYQWIHLVMMTYAIERTIPAVNAINILLRSLLITEIIVLEILLQVRLRNEEIRESTKIEG